MFTKFLHDVEALVPLLMRAYKAKLHFPFAMAEQRVKVANVPELNVKLSMPAVQILTSRTLGSLN